MKKCGRPKGLKPFNAKRSKPCMRDLHHDERRKAKSDKVHMLGTLIATLQSHKPIDFDYLRGVTRRHRAAQLQLQAMRP